LASCVIALGLAACGGNDDDTGPAGEVGAATGKVADEAATAGKAAAEKAGEGTLPENITVGLNQIVGSVEGAQISQAALEEAVDVLGWNLVVCDAQGDPTKMANCMTTLLSQNVDVIFTLSEEAAVLGGGLKAAKAKDVPVLSFGGSIAPSDLFSGIYYENNEQLGEALGGYLAEKFPDESAQMIQSTFASEFCKERDAGMTKAAGSAVEIVASSEVDQANLLAGTRQQVSSMLTQNPDASVAYFCFESAIAAGAQEVANKYPGEQFPERPLVVTYHAYQSQLELIRQGKLDAVAESPFQASAWAATDSAAALLSGSGPAIPSPGQEVDGFPLYDYKVITKEDLPPKGELLPPTTDFVTFFTEKWKQQYGLK
jgi:ABC-type sugar transport system substrate-binding protein